MSRTVEELMYGAEPVFTDDEVEGEEDKELSLEKWTDLHMADLCDAWFDLHEHAKESGQMLFDACTFNDFCEEMYNISKKK